MILVTSGVAHTFVGVYESWAAVKQWLTMTSPPDTGPTVNGDVVEWDACSGLMTLQACIVHIIKEENQG